MFKGELYPFQRDAVEMMLDRGQLLLAVIMGGGKTVVTIAALEELFESGEVECGLIVVPASLKYQWQSQIEAFTDAARVMVIDGTPKKRQEQYLSARRTGEYVIVNYEQVTNDWETISSVDWDFVVCDEVQAIKNFKAKRTKRIKKLTPHYRFGLTGQPVENRPEEVFSILEWIDKDVLGSFHVFDRAFIVRNRFGGVVRYRNLPTLHETLASAMFRRSYDDIADELPTVSTEVRAIPFDRAGRSLYNRIVPELVDVLDDAAGLDRGFDIFSHYGASPNGETGYELAIRGKIMSRMVCLRMLCDHPQLLVESAQRRSVSDEDGSVYALELKERGLLEGLKASPKYSEALSLIREILEDPNNAVVLFSFFKPTLYWMAKELGDVAVTYTGDMNPKQKEQARQRFNNDPNVRVFLSSDAGGVGVDLPSANFLINYDLPWSAGLLDQRNARIRRLSSTHRHVNVVNLVMEGSIEQRQYEMLKKKRAIADAVVDGKVEEHGRIEMDLGTLRDFLTNSQV